MIITSNPTIAKPYFKYFTLSTVGKGIKSSHQAKIILDKYDHFNQALKSDLE